MYKCDVCDYATEKKVLFNKHCNTNKHKKNNALLAINTPITGEIPYIIFMHNKGAVTTRSILESDSLVKYLDTSIHTCLFIEIRGRLENTMFVTRQKPITSIFACVNFSNILTSLYNIPVLNFSSASFSGAIYGASFYVVYLVLVSVHKIFFCAIIGAVIGKKYYCLTG